MLIARSAEIKKNRGDECCGGTCIIGYSEKWRAERKENLLQE